MAPPEAKAWLDAGWQVESVNQGAGEVVFIRAADSQPRNAVRPAAGRLGYVTRRSARAWRRGQRLSGWIPENSPGLSPS